ncbi:hypothetical protein FAEUMB_32100 [Faecalimonas umbilicata]|uniref:Uncharacterized protein n=2 Tax=Faecalimonas umbilicata TaxID=1912855 RepID=A0ABQ0R1P1_9FIRM|nr:hypothetical protein FAEUMB_32100 [Faecalimonas umbilicata]
MVRSISGYQKLHVRDVYQIQNRYARHNLYAVNQAQIRKNLIRIQKLKEDCRYLVSMQIRSRETLLEREKALVKEELYLKQKQRVQEHVAELEPYQKVQQLEQELKEIQYGNRFEEVLDEWNACRKIARTYGGFRGNPGKTGGDPGRKRLIRQIKKIDAERKEQNLAYGIFQCQKKKPGYKNQRKEGRYGRNKIVFTGRIKGIPICVARWQEIDINTIRNILGKRDGMEETGMDVSLCVRWHSG